MTSFNRFSNAEILSVMSCLCLSKHFNCKYNACKNGEAVIQWLCLDITDLLFLTSHRQSPGKQLKFFLKTLMPCVLSFFAWFNLAFKYVRFVFGFCMLVPNRQEWFYGGDTLGFCQNLILTMDDLCTKFERMLSTSIMAKGLENNKQAKITWCLVPNSSPIAWPSRLICAHQFYFGVDDSSENSSTVRPSTKAFWAMSLKTDQWIIPDWQHF